MNHLRLFPTLVAAVFLAVHANAAFPATPSGHSLDVAQFGAKLDGATDDTAAFQRAFDAAPSHSLLHIPAGTAILSGPITVHGKAIHIQGDGMFVTRLVWRRPGGLRLIGAKADNDVVQSNSFQVSNLALLADGENLGTAMKSSFDSPEQTPSIVIENCEFYPAAKTPRGGKYWTKCVEVLNLRICRIAGCRFMGCNGADMTKTTHLIHLLGNCTCFVIDGCHGCDSKYGVMVEGETEGVTIDKCYMVHNECGYVFNTHGKPMFNISQCHAASSRYGIQVVDGRNGAITGCFIALRGDIPLTGDRAGIRLEGSRTRQVAIAATTMQYNPTKGKMEGGLIGIDIAQAKTSP
jgi:hypothetical protein